MDKTLSLYLSGWMLIAMGLVFLHGESTTSYALIAVGTSFWIGLLAGIIYSELIKSEAPENPGP